MKEQLQKYLETELHYTQIGVEQVRNDPAGYAYATPDRIIQLGIQRGLGATQFAMQMGLSYTVAEEAYEAFKARVEVL